MAENKDVKNDIKNLEDFKIDIRETIKNTVLSGYLDECYYVSPLNNNEAQTTIVELLGLSFDDIIHLDQKFFDKVFECLNNDGIYITLAFVERKTKNEFLIKSGDKEKRIFIDSHRDDVLEQEFGTIDFEHVDFGMKITKYEISYGIRHPGDSMPSSPPYFEKYDLNKEMMNLIKDTIVFK